MQEAIQGLEGVYVIVDDFVIFGTGDTEDEIRRSHLKNLVLFLERMKQLNIRLSIEKGKFAVKEAGYMSHTISSNGVRPDPHC